MIEINKKIDIFAMHKFLGLVYQYYCCCFLGVETDHPVLFLLHPAQSRKKKGESSLKDLNVKEISTKGHGRQQKRCG
jgi:hypothetical protein